MRTAGFLFVAAALAATAQNLPQGGGEQVYVTAIEVVADVRDASGKLPAGLRPFDFVVVEDGIERTVVGLDYLRAEQTAGAVEATPGRRPSPSAAASAAEAPWQNVLYFETTLANGTGRVSAAREMMKHAGSLVRMGTVDVVFANPTPVALVRNSRDPEAIRAALKKIAATGGSNQLAAHRRDYLREITNLASLGSLRAASGKSDLAMQAMGAGTGAADAISLGAHNARPYVEQEVRMISDFRDSLMGWLSSYRRHVPRNLILVTDGFDLDPIEFYGPSLSPGAQAELRNYLMQSNLGASAARLGQTLAAGAWTTLSIPSDNNADGWVDDASVSAIGRVHSGSSSGTSPKAFLVRPRDPLNAVAEATGGKVLPSSAHLAEAIDGLDDRVKLTYQVDRKPDGNPRRIEVRPRSKDLTVRSARVATSATPEEQAQARAAGLLTNATYLGDLVTEGSIEWSASTGNVKNGVLRATTNAGLVKQLLGPQAKAQLRITLAVQIGREQVVVNRAAPDVDLSQPLFRFRTPIDVPSNASAIVLVVEETTTGVWGSTRLRTPTSPGAKGTSK